MSDWDRFLAGFDAEPEEEEEWEQAFDGASTVFDDVANWKLLAPVLAMAGESEVVPLERLRRLACGRASRADFEKYGERWTTSLVDLLERGGVGRLERRAGGSVFVFAGSPPTADRAWRRAFASGAV